MTDDAGSDETGGEDTRDYEADASKMGWIAKDKFKGDPEKFIPAKDYVERGEQLLPLVRAENRQLQSQVGQLQGKLQETNTLLKSAQEAIDALKEANTQIAIDKAKEQKAQLRAALTQARRDDDHEKVAELEERLDETTEAIKAAGKPVEKKPAVVEQQSQDLDPTTKTWMAANPWFGTDDERTGLAVGIGKKLRREGSTLQGQAFYDAVKEAVDKVMPFDEQPRRRQKTEGGGSNGGSNGGGGSNRGQGYGDLPADAKEACERMTARVVGKGRAFANVEAWRKDYAQKYFNS